ncbi:hypothetical protein OG393_30885 [Streptomyces sp. NBC_01216]|uniref:hypothetical protein n=1 Tax=Streptomyces sp. NBC_01216 TaxID=2903778 RepID=UPI002E13FF11|nr:hypothetical protein OG393_30885 [Streptomyces sp. NBC_01216]
MTQPSPAAEQLREQIAAAIYEQAAQPHKWPDAHPDDVLAYGGDAQAVMAVVQPLLDRAERAEAEIERMKLLVAASNEDGQAIRMAARCAEKANEQRTRAEKAERRVAEYRDSRRRWMEAAYADRRTANEQHARAQAAEAANERVRAECTATLESRHSHQFRRDQCERILAALDPREPQPGADTKEN